MNKPNLNLITDTKKNNKSDERVKYINEIINIENIKDNSNNYD